MTEDPHTTLNVQSRFQDTQRLQLTLCFQRKEMFSLNLKQSTRRPMDNHRQL